MTNQATIERGSPRGHPVLGSRFSIVLIKETNNER
jgi:hypothetical protein